MYPNEKIKEVEMLGIDDVMETKKYMEKIVENDAEFKEMFRNAVRQFDGAIMALIVDAFLEQYCEKHDIVELTKVRGQSELKRVYGGDK